ncbi:hypothetical protein [Escherichia coli]|nr:hypothetical protein [Escherichia coli]
MSESAWEEMTCLFAPSLAKLMVYSAALTFFTANFHCNMTRKINEYA